MISPEHMSVAQNLRARVTQGLFVASIYLGPILGLVRNQLCSTGFCWFPAGFLSQVEINIPSDNHASGSSASRKGTSPAKTLSTMTGRVQGLDTPEVNDVPGGFR